MASKREQIITYLAASLGTITGLPTFRSRVEPFARNKIPAITVEPAQDTPSSTVIGFLDWSLIVLVTVYVRGEAPDQLADPHIEKIYEKMMADLTLGGLAMGVEPVSYESKLFEGDKPVGCFENAFRVTYRTQEQNLSL